MNDIGDEGTKYLSNALQYNASLLSLNLGRFEFDSFIIIQIIGLDMKEKPLLRNYCRKRATLKSIMINEIALFSLSLSLLWNTL